jgi:hypothetical protein
MTTRSKTPGSSDRVFVRKTYESYFSSAEHANYDAFLNQDGESLKSEPRTRIVLLRREANAAAGQPGRSFVIKIYHYPLLPRIRTGLRISKAEQEFNSLCYMNELGVSAAEPVGYGVERTRLGFVRSCFVITAFEEGTVSLLQWNFENATQKRRDLSQNHDILRQIGKMFQRLHQARFFLFTAKTKNLLVREGAMAFPEIFFVDLPYARTLRPWPLARWAQGRDLGLFFGNFFPALTETETASFYDGYLPDPLGGSAITLRRLVRRAARSKLHLTPISSLVHQFKRILREQVGRFTLLAGLFMLNNMDVIDYLDCIS